MKPENVYKIIKIGSAKPIHSSFGELHQEFLIIENEELKFMRKC